MSAISNIMITSTETHHHLELSNSSGSSSRHLRHQEFEEGRQRKTNRQWRRNSMTLLINNGDYHHHRGKRPTLRNKYRNNNNSSKQVFSFNDMNEARRSKNNNQIPGAALIHDDDDTTTAPTTSSLMVLENGVITGHGELALKWKQKATKEKKKVQEFLLDKAHQGNGAAMALVGDNYCMGSNGFPLNKKEAYRWFQRADAAGNLWGTVMVGMMLLKLEGQGHDHDAAAQDGSCNQRQQQQQEGMMHIAMAASKGSAYAAFLLGMAYAHGMYGIACDKQKALRWLKTALENTSSEGIHGCHSLSKTKKQQAKQTIHDILSDSDSK